MNIAVQTLVFFLILGVVGWLSPPCGALKRSAPISVFWGNPALVAWKPCAKTPPRHSARQAERSRLPVTAVAGTRG